MAQGVGWVACGGQRPLRQSVSVSDGETLGLHSSSKKRMKKDWKKLCKTKLHYNVKKLKKDLADKDSAVYDSQTLSPYSLDNALEFVEADPVKILCGTIFSRGEAVHVFLSCHCSCNLLNIIWVVGKVWLENGIQASFKTHKLSWGACPLSTVA